MSQVVLSSKLVLIDQKITSKGTIEFLVMLIIKVENSYDFLAK
jgi:hypothetical protein